MLLRRTMKLSSSPEHFLVSSSLLPSSSSFFEDLFLAAKERRLLSALYLPETTTFLSTSVWGPFDFLFFPKTTEFHSLTVPFCRKLLVVLSLIFRMITRLIMIDIEILL